MGDNGVLITGSSAPDVDRTRSGRPQRILLTGATGYIGGRLLRQLEQTDHRVRCLARRPAYLRPRVGPDTEVVGGDLLDRASLRRALEDIDTAYYLVHSMGDSGDFEAKERQAAANFAAAATQAGLRRIVYLGGLGHAGEHGKTANANELSPHLSSRHEVGRVLRESGVTTIELRAGIIIGSGSLSFEMVRALVNKLPVLITPRWVRTPTQPLAVEDVIAYLTASLDLETATSQVFEIGGPDRVSYQDLMREYARQRGLKRLFLSVPVLTPRLSSYWLGLVTPLYARIGRKLIDSIKNPTVVHDDRALEMFPIKPRGVEEAIRRALHNEDRELAETRWSDAISSGGVERSWGGVTFGTRRVDSRAVRVDVSPEQAFAPIRRIGGRTGWYFGNGLWRLRGFLDLLVGGVGLRRGRRDPETLVPGDSLDFWRVEAFEPPHRLRLVAEMKLPGRAWLQFEVNETEDGTGSIIRQTAIFDPVGLFGLAYWYGIYPLHAVVFRGMLRGVARAAEREADRQRPEGEARDRADLRHRTDEQATRR